MTIQEAIQKAVDGGYGNDDWREWVKLDVKGLKRFQFSELYETEARNAHFLSPLFWQSLGKALEWNKPDHYGEAQFSGAWEMVEERARNAWKNYWHKFIDHLAEGGPAETYFETLK